MKASTRVCDVLGTLLLRRKVSIQAKPLCFLATHLTPGLGEKLCENQEKQVTTCGDHFTIVYIYKTNYTPAIYAIHICQLHLDNVG